MFTASIENEIIAKAAKNPAFKQDLLRDPKAALARELGVSLPEELDVMVEVARPNALRLVLPAMPDMEATKLSDPELDNVAGRETLQAKPCVTFWTQTTCE